MDKKEARNLYLNGKISKEVFDLLATEDKSEDARSRPVLKSSQDKELIRKASSGDADAYVEYLDVDKAERIKLRKEAALDLEEANSEFENLMRTTIRKTGELKEQLAARIWSEHYDLYEHYQAAMRGLLMN